MIIINYVSEINFITRFPWSSKITKNRITSYKKKTSVDIKFMPRKKESIKIIYI